jgi:hypothetical protein
MAGDKKRKSRARHGARWKTERARYYATTYLENKLKRILKHGTIDEAKKWAKAKIAWPILVKLLGQKNIHIEP